MYLWSSQSVDEGRGRAGRVISVRRCAEEETLEEEDDDDDGERAEKTREQNGAEDNKYAMKPASWSGTARSVYVYMYLEK